MKYDEIVDKIEVLLSINSDRLDEEATRRSKIFVELQKMYRVRASKLVKLIDQQKVVYFNRRRHYEGKMPGKWYKDNPLNEAVLKTDVPMYMDVDTAVIEIKGLVHEEELIVKLIEDAMKQLGSRSFDIQNALEFRKQMGGY